jgi:ABC-type lipoprotein export system ATPase subunit
MDHHPSQMSGGQQQRVAIARALINRPKILFADEPTGNLDSKTSEEVLHMFQELNEKEGITIVLVTHSPEVGAFAKEAYHIKDGLMVDGTY